jgi:hypothetical protein
MELQQALHPGLAGNPQKRAKHSEVNVSEGLKY